MDDKGDNFAREELNILLNAAIELAMKLLALHESHRPFAITLRSDGSRLNFLPDDTEVRDNTVLVASLLQELKTKCECGELRAIAFATNIDYRSAVDGTHVDAIEVDLDHLRDRAVTCMLPYGRDGRGKPVPRELFAIEPRQTFFDAVRNRD